MQFAAPLIPARLVKRYKRFLADVTLDTGESVTVLCPNTGAMTGLTAAGTRIWLSRSANPTRKYALTWELAEVRESGLTGVNTQHPNRIVAAALKRGAIPQLAGYEGIRPEVRYAEKSRIDLLLQGKDRPDCYVEIKNVHLFRGGDLAEFPDCVTDRGRRHLEDLAAMVRRGHRAVMVYLIQSNTARRFTLAADLDPAYVKSYAAARQAGVEALALACCVSTTAITVDRPVPVIGP